MKSFLIIGSFFQFLSLATAITINCSFMASPFDYVCYLEQPSIVLTATDRTITAITGTHESGKSNNDVTIFSAYGYNLKYIPLGLPNLFPKLSKLTLENCQIGEIFLDDLKDYSNLVTLDLNNNKISSIKENTFLYNSKLTSLTLSQNLLTYFPSNEFMNMPNLESIYFWSNPCVSIYASTPDTVISAINSIKVNCSGSTTPTTTILPTTTAAPTTTIPPTTTQATPSCTSCCQINDIAASVTSQIQNIATQLINTINSLSSNICTKSDLTAISSSISTLSSSLTSFNSAINSKLDSIITKLNSFPTSFANITATIKNLDKKLCERLEWVEYRLKKVEKKASCSRSRRY